MARDDEDTSQIRLPAGQGAGERPTPGGELSPSSGGLSERWQVARSYEFATPEAALMYVACAVAVSAAAEVWPSVELSGRRVGLRMGGPGKPDGQERAAWRELLAWARRLAGREV